MLAAPSSHVAAARAAPSSLPDVLPAANRMRRPDEFADAFDGARARAGRIALRLGRADVSNSADLPAPKVGFVVSKKVGNSVQRHRITRQLRHILRPWLTSGRLSDGERLVVQALPGSAGSSFAQLEADIEAAYDKCRRKAEQASLTGAASTAPSSHTPRGKGGSR